jgi:hypothetical protein
LKSGIETVISSVLSNSIIKALGNSPSGLGVYYGKQGSAVQNANRIFKLAKNVSLAYGLKKDEELVLLTSCLFSTLPCIDCYAMNECAPEETKSGRLLGFKSLMQMRLFGAWKTLKTAPNREWLLRILHVLGCDESSLKPCTKEAIIFAKIRQIDTLISESFDYIEREECWEDGFSTFDVKNGRRYYVIPIAGE